MKLPKSSGKPRRPKLLIRRIAGSSMLPTFRANQIVIASGWFTHVDTNDVVIFMHHGLEKIKRVSEVDSHKGVYVLGDNAAESTDSRSFGWIDSDEVLAKVVWPRRNKKSQL